MALSTQERRKLVRRLLKAGHSQKVLARLFGVSEATITRDKRAIRRRRK